ncbi:MAG: Verru_Chthon cassette protein B [Verrucomicrobium sp.]|nr:Verru_Chthon cassette protein B [Verrucomicrobium sp.]
MSWPSHGARVHRPQVAGFSLVEVALTLGIISFVFVTVFGLLPVGLDVSRQAIDTTVSGQITQQMINEAQQTDFSGLQSLAAASVAEPWCFDDQGSKAVDLKSTLYKAVYQVAPTAALPSGASTQNLAVVTVCVLNSKGVNASKDLDLYKNPASRKTTILVPDNGR